MAISVGLLAAAKRGYVGAPSTAGAPPTGSGNASSTINGTESWPFRAVAEAMEVIPRTLVQNAGGNAIRVLTELRAHHASGEGGNSWGVNGETGKVVDMKEYALWESASVKIQTLKTAIEVIGIL